MLVFHCELLPHPPIFSLFQVFITELTESSHLFSFPCFFVWFVFVFLSKERPQVLVAEVSKSITASGVLANKSFRLPCFVNQMHS